MTSGERRRFVVTVIRRVWKFVALFFGINAAAALAFLYLQPGTMIDNAFYWAIVTISTTGYGDVVPTTQGAKLFTMGLLYTQIFLIGYLFSVITGIVTSEAQNRALGTLGTSMTDHVVVLGYSGVGHAAVRELLAEGQKVAVVTERADEVANIRTLGPESRLYATYGPPADNEILRRANVAAARSVIVCTTDDTTNLIASLNVRAVAPKVRIVVSVTRPELKDTLRAAGVTYVASPSDMGGRLCASAAFRPDVANAVEDLTTATYGADIQEFVLREGHPLATESFGGADGALRGATGCIAIGFARSEKGEYQTTLNPPESARLRPGDALLVLGSLENLRCCPKYFGVESGR